MKRYEDETDHPCRTCLVSEGKLHLRENGDEYGSLEDVLASVRNGRTGKFSRMQSHSARSSDHR